MVGKCDDKGISREEFPGPRPGPDKFRQAPVGVRLNRRTMVGPWLACLCYARSPRRARAVMRSAARKARASMVMVGWPRPEVTKLLPSQRKRFFTSWVRWSELITDVLASLPMRQLPRR